MCSIYSFRVRSFSPCSSPHPLSGVEREQTNASILRRDLLTTSGTYADACAQLVHVASAFDQLLALKGGGRSGLSSANTMDAMEGLVDMNSLGSGAAAASAGKAIVLKV